MGVSLAVAAVPEGLPAILSVVLSIGVQQMAKQNAIVKNLSSVETLGSSSVIATDKTGTLTKNEMTILRVITSNGVATLEGVGYAPRGQVIGTDGPLIGDQLAEVELLLAGGAYRDIEDDPGEEISGDWESDLVFVGILAMIDPPRDAAKRSIKRAHDAGIRVMMITGDHPSTAKRIAVDLGIIPEDGAVLTGNDLDELTGEQFDEAISETSVYARVAPEHKMKIVHSLQDKGEIVAMTGDGVNDAPALKSADIGVAMGITGTEVSKQSAKMLLVDDNFSTIVYAVEEGRKIFDNIRKFLRYLLSSNMGEVFTMFLGISLASVIGLYLIDPESGAHILQTPLARRWVEAYSRVLLTPRNDRLMILLVTTLRMLLKKIAWMGSLWALTILSIWLKGSRQALKTD